MSKEVADESDGPANEDRESNKGGEKGGEQTVDRNKLVLMPFLCKLKD